MANEFKIKKGLIVDGDSTFSGSLESTQAVTASFFTGSFSGDGTNLTGIAATPAGSDTEIQFNNAGALGASSNLSYSNGVLEIGYIGGAHTKAIQLFGTDRIIGTDGSRQIRLYTDRVNIGEYTGVVDAALAVKGSGATDATTALLIQNSSGTDLLKVEDGGNVGIGTASPTHQLSVAEDISIGSTGNDGLIQFKRGSNGADIAKIGVTSTTLYVREGQGSGGQLQTYDGTSALHWRYNAAGDTRVGINTNTTNLPAASLLIKGAGTTSATTTLLVEDSAGTDLLKVEDGGNVGIGTSSPVEKLTVEGNISGSGNVNIVGDVTASAFVGDGSALTGVTAEWDGSHNGDAEITGSLVISGSSVDLTVEGRVQVNEGTVNRSIQLRNDGLYISRTADGAYLSRVVGTSNGNQIDVAGQSAVNLKIATNIALRIDTNRNIGIGTSAAAPGGRLHVKGAGTTSATNALLVENSSGTDLLTVRDDGQLQVSSTGVTNPGYSFADNTNSGLYNFGSTHGTVVDGQYSILYNAAGPGIYSNVANSITAPVLGLYKIGDNNRFSIWMDNTSKDFIFEAWESGVGYDNSIILNSDGGTVSVGTTDTDSKLQVRGSGATSATTALLIENSSGTDLFKIEDGGNVGIGTSTPAEKLTVSGNISGSGDLNIVGDVTASAFVGDGSALTNITAEWDGSHNGDAEITGSLVVSGSSVELGVEGRVNVSEGTTNRSIQLRDDGLYMSRTSDGGNVAQIRATSNGNNIDVRGQTGINLNISTNNALRIDGSRNVGIGAGTTPSARLHVKGSGTTDATTALLVENSSGTDLFKIEDGGNVGIGTTSTTAKLNVDGGISTSGTSGDIDSSRSFILSTLGTNRGGIYSDQILTGDVGKSLDDVVLYSANGAIHLTEGTVTNKVLTVSGSSVGIGTDSPDEKLHVVGNAKITGGVTGSSFTGSFVGDGSGLTGIGGGTPGGSDTQIQFNDGGAFGGDSNLTFNGTILTVGTPISMESVLKETFTASSLPSSTANVIAALDYSGTSRVGMFFDYVVIDNTGNMRAGTVMVGTNGTNITFTDNSTADIGSTTGVTWSAVLNTGNQTVDLTLTTPATGAWSTTIYVKSI